MNRTSLAARLSALSPEKRRLIEMELAAREAKAREAGAPPAIVRRPGKREFPLSFAQERLWFLHRLDPASTAYHLSTSTVLRGVLDVRALARALGELMRRQESLRTSFPLVGEEPVQRVHETLPAALPRVDLRGLASEAREREILRFAAAWSRRPFDLEAGPLFRVALVRTGVGTHAFLLAMHHIISDGWSLGVLLRELSALYQAFSRDERPALSEPAVQPGDYAHWQRRWLSGETLDAELAFWRERLEGAPPLLELPADRPRPPVQSFRGRVLPLSFSPETGEGLRRLAKSRSTTLFVVLLAAYDVLLARLSGQLDLPVGTPIAGRHHEETEGLIGFFVNTLVIRSDLSGDPTFVDLVARVHATVLDAHAHQEVPFEKLVQELQPERSLSHSPLFQVMFAMLNIPRGSRREEAEPGASGLSLSPGSSVREAAQFDLHLEVSDSRDELTGSVQYAVDLFDAVTVARWIGYLERLLEAVARDAERPISTLPMLTPAEAVQVRGEWNDTACAYPEAEASLHGLVLARAARTLDAVAVTRGGEHLSYGELVRRSRNLAGRLLDLDLGPEPLVAISMERSVELSVGLLAILEAGGAWVPLDPSYPAERLGFLLEDSGAGVLLTHRALAGELPESTARVLDVEEGVRDGEGGRSSPVQRERGGERAAYVIYTSGTTGRPKGAVNSHRAIVNRLLWMQEAYGLEPCDRVLQKTPFSFDVSVWELFWPLLIGAELVYARPEGHRDPAYLRRLIDARRITTLHFVPSMLQVFLAASDGPTGSSLRRVIASGEALTPELRELFHQRSTAELHNLYGPTEAAIDVTYHAVSRGERGAVPIGRPIANLTLHVLDRWGRPAPIGVAGELLIGGTGLARGYHRRPSLSAEKFVPDGVGETPGARLYRTGDLARCRAGGEIDFLGRLDHQVKIRGFRVELGEIETGLLEHPGIAEAACLVREDRPGDPRIAAFFVPAGDEALEAGELRAFLGAKLPEHVIPTTFVALDALPTTPNGKLDRKALAARALPEAVAAPSGAAPSGEIEEGVAEIWRRVLGVEQVGTRDNFFDLGGHSLLLVQVQTRVRERFGRELPIVDFFRHPTVGALARALAPDTAPAPVPATRRHHAPAVAREIAVIGMAGRFPKAPDLRRFWRNLCEGVEGVRFYSDEELLEAGIDRATLDDPAYVKACAFLDEPTSFDNDLFAVAPREAQVMDPQQRIFLECAWEVLEDAGYDPETYGGAIGVFGGLGLNYYLLNLIANPEVTATLGFIPVALANANDYLATRVSYKLGLRGPSLTVQTACSTSLVATHLACESLRRGECDMALAGGVSVAAYHAMGYPYSEGGILSPDGHCRPFDAKAGGTVAGNGAGMVVLKRLADALADGDRVRAVIRGSAINNDGSAKVGFTAPSVEGQAAVIAEALRSAGVVPGELSYVEAHGSATPLGDPIEVAALHQALGGGTGRRCALGAVKSNIGHTDAAAGVAGLIKTVLALENRRIPPTLHFETPNPRIDFDAGPLYVNTELVDWPAEGAPRRAGVSAFGLGGTNVHVVVEEAPGTEAAETLREHHLLALSAASAGALDALGDRWADALDAGEPLDGAELADAVYTSHVGRRRLEHRRVVVGRAGSELARVLRERDPTRLLSSVEERRDRPVAFLFPGLGDHGVHMARKLYRVEPTFREEVDRCCEILARHLELDLREVLYPEGAEPAPASPSGEPDLRRLLGRAAAPESDADRLLGRTRVAQPAVFVVEWALARLWRQWGVTPEAMIGYSLGEYTAACLAGVMTLEDALAVVAERARLIDGLPAGAMLAVPLREKEAEARIAGTELSLAALNSPRVSVVAGPEDGIAALEEELAASDLVCQRLRTTHAFHSTMMEPIVEVFAERMGKVTLSPPRIPFLSNVTGTWITPREATDPAYWARHLRQTVRFTDGLRELYRDAGRILVEVGPGQALSTSARQHPARLDGHLVVSSLGDARLGQDDEAAALSALGRLWLGGATIDWRGFWSWEQRRRAEAPTYPFERRPFFIENKPRPAARQRPRGKLAEIADWFYVPRWQAAPPRRLDAEKLAAEPASWLILSDALGLGERLAGRLDDLGQRVVAVEAGEPFEGVSDGRATLDPGRPEDYRSLLDELDEQGFVPRHVLHAWSLGIGEEPFEDVQARGVYSLLYLVRALAGQGLADELQVAVITDGLDRVDGSEKLCPAKATMVGTLKVIPQEFRNLTCRTVDLVLPGGGDGALDALAEKVLAEVNDLGHPERRVVYRRGGRWVRRYDPLPLPASDGSPPVLEEGGVYLVTGGFGKVGRIVSRALAERFRARLVLTGRSPLPEPESWDEHLARRGEGDATSRRILHLRELEAAGAEVLGLSADAVDRGQMAAALDGARQRFGRLDGIFHLAGSLADDELLAPAEATTPVFCHRHFAPKAAALETLRDLLAEDPRAQDPPGFCALFSSMSSVLGGLGFAAYAASNAFMDAFAEARADVPDGTRWMSLDWDGWLSPEESAPQAGDGLGASVADLAMTPAESVEALLRGLTMLPAPRLVVSVGDLDTRLDQWVRFTSGGAEDRQDPAGDGSAGSRPDLQTPYVAPSNDTESRIAELWQDLLGISQVGVHDNFFELGGDSLLGTQLVSRLRQALHVELPMLVFFDAPTVAQLARVAEQDSYRRDDLSEIAAVLEEIQGLSADELREEIESRSES